MKRIKSWLTAIAVEAIQEVTEEVSTEVETAEAEPCSLRHREPPTVTGSTAVDYVLLPNPGEGCCWHLAEILDLGPEPRDYFVRNGVVLQAMFEIRPIPGQEGRSQ